MYEYKYINKHVWMQCIVKNVKVEEQFIIKYATVGRNLK